ncbi:MAG: peptidylprolyl isomerase [Bacteroidales bacterium]
MKIKLIILLVITSVAFFACKSSKTGEVSPKDGQIEKAVEPVKAPTLAFDPTKLPEEPIFNINTTEGIIKIKLYKETPLHKANFIKLASERFYDNIIFHRVIKNFMIQVGDPLTKDTTALVEKYGTGGPGYTIPAEILSQFKHKKGALAAARRPDTSNPNKESSGSQFYIVQDVAACSQLDGDYTIFGETVGGLDIIDKIATVPTGKKNFPITPIRIISITPVTE